MDISKIVVEDTIAIVKGKFRLGDGLLKTQACRESICIVVELVPRPHCNRASIHIFQSHMSLLGKIVWLEQIECHTEPAVLAGKKKRVVAHEICRNTYPERDRDGRRFCRVSNVGAEILHRRSETDRPKACVVVQSEVEYKTGTPRIDGRCFTA